MMRSNQPMHAFCGALLAAAVFACTSSQGPGQVPLESPEELGFALDPSRKLSVGIVVVDGVYNTELTAPMDIFQHTIFHHKSGMSVFLVGPSLEPLRSFEGLGLLPDYAFEAAPEIDILVLPSAEHSMDSDLDDARLMSFVRERGEAASIVLSLCDGAFVLAAAGLLNGRQATTFPSDIEAFERDFPALHVQRDVSFVRHGKFVTSVGGEPSFAAALYICERLYGAQVARGLAGGLVIDWKLAELKFIELP